MAIEEAHHHGLPLGRRRGKLRLERLGLARRERAHGLDALIHDVIAKPFSLSDIRKAVAEALVTRGR